MLGQFLSPPFSSMFQLLLKLHHAEENGHNKENNNKAENMKITVRGNPNSQVDPTKGSRK